MAWNILAKRVKGKEYLLHDFMATTLNEKQFKELKAINQETLGEYDFIPQAETDFSWWDKVNKKLTHKKITSAYFDIDYYGNVSEI